MGEKVKQAFRSFVFDGIVLILLGVILLLWPENTMELIFQIIGGVCAAVGLIHCILFFTRKPEARNWVDLVIGIIQLALGIVMLVKPDFFVKFFYLAIGVLTAYGCILMAIQIFRLRKIDPFRYYASLVFSLLLLGLAIVVFLNPASFGNFLFRLHGIAMIVEGLSLIVVMSRKEKDAG